MKSARGPRPGCVSTSRHRAFPTRGRLPSRGAGSPHAAPATAASLRAEESERKIPEGTPARRAELSREPRHWHVLRPSAGVATLRARGST